MNRLRAWLVRLLAGPGGPGLIWQVQSPPEGHDGVIVQIGFYDDDKTRDPPGLIALGMDPVQAIALAGEIYERTVDEYEA